MNIRQNKVNDELTVYVEGNIDTSSSPALYDYLEKEMKGIKKLVLDFEKTEYVSSAGLRVILFAQKTMTKQGQMIITHVNSDIMDVFEITCFTDILTII